MSDIATKKHPRGLYILFGTEAWERFSYYGMRAILVLYLCAAVSGAEGHPGLGFEKTNALALYGIYTGLVYLTPLIGGFLCDNILGARKAIIIGGILMAFGELGMCFPALLYPALALLIIGNGFFKPNISNMVGGLYEENDPRRDGGFTIFYMGINLGAFLAPLICGFLASQFGYRWGFAAACVGMIIGQFTFNLGSKRLGLTGFPPDMTDVTPETKLRRSDWMDIFGYVIGMGLIVAISMAVGRLGFPSSPNAPLPIAVILMTATAAYLFSQKKKRELAKQAGLAASTSRPESTQKDTNATCQANSTGATKADSTGTTKADSTGTTQADSTGATKPDSTGATQADSTGATQADSTGATKLDSTGVTQSDSTAATKADGTGSTQMPRSEGATRLVAGFTIEEWQRIAVILILSGFVIFFWMGYEQAGGTMTLFAEERTNRVIDGYTIPASWFQCIAPLVICLFAPLFSMMWYAWDNSKYKIGTSYKMAIGLFFLSLGFVVMYYADSNVVCDAQGKVLQGVSPLWLSVVYFLHTMGELCLSPVGLSMITKLSPPKIVSLMMGCWLGASAVANYCAGMLQSFLERFDLNMWHFLIFSSAGAGVVLLMLGPVLKRWSHGR